MKNRKFALVVPNNRLLRPEFCRSYYDNLVKFDRNLDDFVLIIVDDYSPYFKDNMKTLEKSGLQYEYWSVKMQIDFFKENFGSEWERYWRVIPHRTDACRSFGYLIAALEGADVIITADDDNYAITDSDSKDYDYLGAHDIVNSTVKYLEISSSNNWFNTISMLKTIPERELYARGYPYSKRLDKPIYKYDHVECRVVMNVGLWIGNPDVDSITVLSEGSLNGLPVTRTISFKSEIKRVILAKGTFAPLNTANTAYSKKILPIIYDTFQGAKVGELKLDRFGDIWCNFFVKKILDRTNDRVSIGIPLVEHRREPRNTFEDLKKELWGIIISEKLFNIVEKLDLYSQSYADLYKELVENLRILLIKELEENLSVLKKYFEKLFSCMLDWLEILEKLSLV